MKKTKYTLTQTDIIVYAIEWLAEKVKKYDDLVKTADPSMKEMLKDNEFFFKFKKLLELYELQTGKEYSVEWGFDFLKEE